MTLRLERVRAAAVADDDHGVADADVGRGAARERRRAEAAERLHQAEAGRLVVGERIAGHRPRPGWW